MKLTERQIAHLRKLNDNAGPRGAYGNGLNLGTLASLEKRGLVKAWRGLGSMASPRVHIKWQITAAGKEAVHA